MGGHFYEMVGKCQSSECITKPGSPLIATKVSYLNTQPLI